jgi:hypothetical protein
MTTGHPDNHGDPADKKPVPDGDAEPLAGEPLPEQPVPAEPMAQPTDGETAEVQTEAVAPVDDEPSAEPVEAVAGEVTEGPAESAEGEPHEGDAVPAVEEPPPPKQSFWNRLTEAPPTSPLPAPVEGGWRWFPIVAALVCFVLYCIGFQDKVLWGDAGEIASGVARLGVIHPTGYPLYTLLGHLFLFLPLPLTVAGKLSLFSAVCISLALYFFARAGSELAVRLSSDRSQIRPAHVLGATIGALGFGCGPIIFSQAVIVEVYGLHLVLMSLTAWCLVRFELTADRNWVRLAALPLGLGMTCHITTSHMAPGIFLFVLLRDPKFYFSKQFWQGVLIAVSCLALYAYLPIADKTTDGFGWGGTSRGWNYFWPHVSARPYHHYVFGDSKSTIKHLKAFPQKLAENLWLTLPLLLWVAVQSVRHRSAFVVFGVISAAIGMTHAIGYNVGDYQVFFAGAFSLVCLLGAGGWGSLFDSLNRRLWAGNLFIPLHRAQTFAATAVILLMLAPLGVGVYFAHKGATDVHTSEAYGRELTTEIPAGSILFGKGDGVVFVMQYFQFVLRQGTGIALINVGRFGQDWYADHVKRMWPFMHTFHTGSRNRMTAELIKANVGVPGKPRVFERDGFDDKNVVPKGYRLVCRGQYNEILKGDPNVVYAKALSHVTMAPEGIPNQIRKHYLPDETIVVKPGWKRRLKTAAKIKWVAPDGTIAREYEKGPADAKGWDVAMKFALPGKAVGGWHLVVEAEDTTIFDIPFWVVSELPPWR